MTLNNSEEAALEDRRAKAWLLRLKGKTIRQIAIELGVSVGTAHTDIKTVLERTREENDERAETHRTISLARLERALDTVETVLSAETFDQAGNKDHELQLKALDRLVRIEERRAKLLGLDATKVELSGPEGAPIPVDATTALIERLAGLVASEAAGTAAQGDSSSADAAGDGSS